MPVFSGMPWILSMPLHVGLRLPILILLILLVLLILLIFLSLAIGSRDIPLMIVVEALSDFESDGLLHRIVRERLPRTVFALLAGAALGISGLLMQAITRNPIADPSILGVNTGASLSIVIGLSFFTLTSPMSYILWAIVGASLAAVLVYSLGSLGYGGATPIKLALAGAATTASLSSINSALLLPRTEVMNAYRFWQIGSLSGATWEGILWMLPFIVFACATALYLAPSLDAMAMGDEMAIGLGVRTGRIRMLSAISGIMLCAVTTALAGPIGFIGLMVPHMVKQVMGIRLQRALPYSAIVGAMLLTFADVIGRRFGSPGEIEVGIITAMMGAPLLIWIVKFTKTKL